MCCAVHGDLSHVSQLQQAHDEAAAHSAVLSAFQYICTQLPLADGERLPHALFKMSAKEVQLQLSQVRGCQA